MLQVFSAEIRSVEEKKLSPPPWEIERHVFSCESKRMFCYSAWWSSLKIEIYTPSSINLIDRSKSWDMMALVKASWAGYFHFARHYTALPQFKQVGKKFALIQVFAEVWMSWAALNMFLIFLCRGITAETIGTIRPAQKTCEKDDPNILTTTYRSFSLQSQILICTKQCSRQLAKTSAIWIETNSSISRQTDLGNAEANHRSLNR